jgi:hypothetical protein
MCNSDIINLCSPFICDNITFRDIASTPLLSIGGDYTFIVTTGSGGNTQKKTVNIPIGQPIVANLYDIATPVLPLIISIKSPNGTLLQYRYSANFQICTN